MPRALSLAIVGSQFPNKRGPDRRFEIALCAPGDPVELVHEPRNPADRNAVMIVSERGVRMGYVAADRTSLIHRAWSDANDVRGIFQAKTSWGGWVRVTLDGSDPVLPPSEDVQVESRADDDSGFWPDWEPPDD